METNPETTNKQDTQTNNSTPVTPPAMRDGHRGLIILVVVVLVIAGAILLLKGNSYKPNLGEVTKQSSVKATEIAPAEVSIGASGFTPATIKVKIGQSVNWKNDDLEMHQVAADPYPSHSSLPSFVGESLNLGDTYSYTFEKKGTFTYHDELNPMKFSGTVIVE